MRFEFGDNWKKFLESVDAKRIEEAEASLLTMLRIQNLAKQRFLDVGSGSGLFSLAARKLGAQVRSFDYDANSVACTMQLRQRYFPDDPGWLVERGDILDNDFLKKLGAFDVVYAWGVLHHSGHLWQAIENTAGLVASQGTLFLAIYNDQGWVSHLWRFIKWLYNLLPSFLRWLIVIPVSVRIWGRTILKDVLRARPLASWRAYVEKRGMSPFRDVIDWVGGYPFEVAKPEEVISFCRGIGLALESEHLVGHGYGCNQFIFRRSMAKESVQ